MGAGGSGGNRVHRARASRSPREARAGRVSQIRHAELSIEALVLRDAADWAGEHGVDLDDPFATGPAGGVGKQIGSDGTPWIDEHVAKEYGALRGTSTFEATELIIDALDLRHRFPRLWLAIRELRVRVRDARRISKACRELSAEAAGKVDAELARKAAYGLPWPRLSRLLAAAIINADPALHQARLNAAKFDRRVWLSETEDGLRTLVIKADAGDQVLLYALIDRIADILKLEGDTDPVDQRRAKAAGWLARPEDLVVLLYRHSSYPPGGGNKTSEEPTAASTTAEEPTAATADQPTQDADATARDIADPTAHGATTDDQTPDADPSDADPSTGGGGSGSPGGEDEPPTPVPPDDHPGYHWGAPEPPWDPGVSDRLPRPRGRFYGTQNQPDPEPYGPTWDYDPPPDDGPPPPPDPARAGPPGTRLGCDLPRLVDYLTAKGLKPVPPRVELQVHLTDQTLLTGNGIVRSEDCGPMLLAQLTELLGRHHCQISLRPVLDPANLAAVDAYEVSQPLRDAVRLRHPASIFPFSSRLGHHLDLDHTVPHTHTSDPPGQTRLGNLGPLARPEHRAKTDGVWHLEQPHPGVFLWRSPHRHYFLVTNQGTQPLGPLPRPEAETSTAPPPTSVHITGRRRRHRGRGD